MSDRLTPLEVCIAAFGSREAVEAIAGCKPKGSYAWARASTNRRAGDLPPYVQRKLLAAARRRQIELEPVFLIEGATKSAVERLRDPRVAAE